MSPETTKRNDISRVLEGMSRTNDPALIKERRARIVAAAARLFAENGFERTTIQEVAGEAGISTGLVYRYVRDKEDLLLLSILDVLDSYATEIPAAVDGVVGSLARCRAAFAAYCRVVDARRQATLLAYRSTYSLAPERRRLIMDAERKTNRLIGACIQDCIDDGLFRPVDTGLATYQAVMHAHAWALKYWYFAERTDLETYIAEGFDLFLHALLTDEGREALSK